MQKILVDLTKIANLYSGLGQFSAQFGKYLSEEYSHEFDFHFLVPRKHDLQFSHLITEVKVRPIFKFWKASHEQYDLWHSLYQFPSYKPSDSFKQLLTIHDLNFLIEKTGSKQEKYQKRMNADVKRADYLSTISNFSKQQIKNQLTVSSKRINVIHNGVADLTSINPQLPKFELPKKFFFSISLFSPKKNFDVLLPMMRQFPDFKLILAGNHENAYGDQLKRLITSQGLEQQVIMPGIISEAEKTQLYKSCSAFLFPSKAEGFGLPVVEALQFGKPVFLSKLTSLPEIGGTAASFFESFDHLHMADLIKSELDKFDYDPVLYGDRLKKQASKYTWKKCMQKYIQLYHECTQ